jgi:cell division protein FtsI/penicillin-binding protein 2
MTKRKKILSDNQKTRQNDNDNSWIRGYLLGGLILILFSGMLWRSFSLQVLGYEKYKENAERQHTSELKTVGKRGAIYSKDFKSGELFPMAVNKTVYDVIVDPNILRNQGEAFQNVALEELKKFFPEVGEDKITESIAKQNDSYELLIKDVDEQKMEELKSILTQKKLLKNGINFEPHQRRFYPEGQFASHVLGFVRKDDAGKGQYGLEQFYNEFLNGVAGYEKKLKDNSGVWIPIEDKEGQKAEDGMDLVLTIDPTVQFKMEETLAKLSEDFKPKTALGIVMNPNTGEIYAMASNPNFDPNKYFEVEDVGLFLNPIVSSTYEPGSIFKPLTMSMGIDTGVVVPTTTYYDKGTLAINDFNISNVDEKSYGTQTMYNVLEKSLNTGVVFVGNKLGRDTFKQYLEKFRINQTTGVDLPGEIAGNFDNLTQQHVRDIHFATATYGQGVAVTPIEMLTAFNSLVNGGKLMKPFLVSEKKSPSGDIIKTEPEVLDTILSTETSNTMKDMLVSVVQNGHPKKAGVEGFLIGGKTGTAQKASVGGYSEDTVQSFVEFATLSNPKFSMLIMLDSPIGARFADSSVVPASHELNKFLLTHFEMIPDAKTDAPKN